MLVPVLVGLLLGLGGCIEGNRGATKPDYGVLAFSYYVMGGDADQAVRFLDDYTVESLGGKVAAQQHLERLHDDWLRENRMSVKILSVQSTADGAAVRVSIQNRNRTLRQSTWRMRLIDEMYFIDLRSVD